MGLPGGTSGKEPACQCRRCKERQVWSLGQEDPWRREWQPTPVFLSGESHEQRSLVGYSPWGHKVKHDRSDLARIQAHKDKIVVVSQSPNCVQPFVTPWTAARQASLSLTHLLKFAQVHVHCTGDAIQPSHPLILSSPSALNCSQHQGLF